MKFNLKPNHPKHSQGDRREVVKFAWFPKKLDDCNIVVWLERYISIEKFVKRYHLVADGPGYYANSWLEIHSKGIKG